MKLAHLKQLEKPEPYWHVQVAVLVAITLQLILKDELTVGPKYVIAGLEVLLVIALFVVSKRKHRLIYNIRHGMAVALIAIISVANISSLILVISDLFGHRVVSGKDLILSGLAIFLTNIIIFGLWYWELDNAGLMGKDSSDSTVDFLFPQMSDRIGNENGVWSPTFLDYLYVSVTNATAFSPTDTMPLTHRAKSLMSLQSLVSLITVALVAARAVNILQ
ncbi:MAG: hypothetical protein ACHQT9_03650, partial [Candidatus Saccharimonadales bacterium]